MNANEKSFINLIFFKIKNTSIFLFRYKHYTVGSCAEKKSLETIT